MVALYEVWYNFIRIHKTLRVSPAMESGIADRLFSFEELREIVDEWEPGLAQSLERLLSGIFIVAVVNFVVFVFVAEKIGGDAVNGTMRDGHYFLSNHGQLTEVSARVYTYSLWHVRSVWVTHSLAIVAAFWWKWLHNRSSTVSHSKLRHYPQFTTSPASLRKRDRNHARASVAEKG